LGRLIAGGAGDVFPRIHEDFKEKSSIPQGLPCGSSSYIVSFCPNTMLFGFWGMVYGAFGHINPYIFSRRGFFFENFFIRQFKGFVFA
jgi:hypothetical protein